MQTLDKEGCSVATKGDEQWNLMESRILAFLSGQDIRVTTIEEVEHERTMKARQRLLVTQ